MKVTTIKVAYLTNNQIEYSNKSDSSSQANIRPKMTAKLKNYMDKSLVTTKVSKKKMQKIKPGDLSFTYSDKNGTPSHKGGVNRGSKAKRENSQDVIIRASKFL